MTNEEVYKHLAGVQVALRAFRAMVEYYRPMDDLIMNGCEHGFKPAALCPNADCKEAALQHILSAVAINETI